MAFSTSVDELTEAGPTLTHELAMNLVGQLPFCWAFIDIDDRGRVPSTALSSPLFSHSRPNLKLSIHGPLVKMVSISYHSTFCHFS